MTAAQAGESPGWEPVDVAVGLAAPTLRFAVRGLRGAVRMTAQPLRAVTRPAVRRTEPHLSAAIRALADEGRLRREQMMAKADEAARLLLPAAATAMLERLDVVQLVNDNVDLDAIVEPVDVNAIAARLDLLGLAQYVVDGIDLPAIVRDASLGVTSDAVRGVRMRGYGADQAVARAVDRVLLRRGGRHTVDLDVSDSNGSSSNGSDGG